MPGPYFYQSEDQLILLYISPGSMQDQADQTVNIFRAVS